MILSWVILITASLICYTGFALRRGRHLDWLELMTNKEISSQPTIADSIGLKLLILGFAILAMGIWTYFSNESGMMSFLIVTLLLVSGYTWIRSTK